MFDDVPTALALQSGFRGWEKYELVEQITGVRARR